MSLTVFSFWQFYEYLANKENCWLLKSGFEICLKVKIMQPINFRMNLNIDISIYNIQYSQTHFLFQLIIFIITIKLSSIY